MLRGVRGAITVDTDQAEKVLEATQELLLTMQRENSILVEDIASILFSTTADIRSVFPAQAARSIGWVHVPLMCFQEIEVPGSLPMCIRVLMHINTNKPQSEIRHIYLKEASKLRPDLIN
jgi:chorismate mutase